MQRMQPLTFPRSLPQSISLTRQSADDLCALPAPGGMDSDEWHFFILLLRLLGARSSEALQVTGADFIWRKDALTICLHHRVTFVGFPASRSLPLSPRVWELAATLIARHQNSHLFPSLIKAQTLGKGLQRMLLRRYTSWLREARVLHHGFSLAYFRTYAATTLKSAGESKEDVCYFLGSPYRQFHKLDGVRSSNPCSAVS